jgi:hypothetical protein
MWNFETEQFTGDREKAIATYNKNCVDDATTQERFLELMALRKPFSFIRIGDIEACFLAVSTTKGSEREKLLSRLWWCGIDKNNLPDPNKFASIIKKADMVCVQESIYGADKFWGPSYEAFKRWNLLDEKKYYAVHTMYKMAGTNIFWNSLQGKKVIWVGAKAPIFKRFFYSDKHYRETFPFMNLGGFNLIDTIPTFDLDKSGMNFKRTIEDAIRRSYKQKADVYLFSCGILAKYLAEMVKIDGFIGLDVGNVLETIMNLANKRPFMEVFANYTHQQYEFVINQRFLNIDKVIPRKRLTM